MGNRYNPVTEEIEFTGCKEETVSTPNTGGGFPYTTFIAGKIGDLEEGYANIIDACTLPITKERQTLDLGELSELCD